MSPSRLVLGAAHSTLLVEDYEPAAPHGNQLQVRIRATSLNHLDWKRIKKNLFIPTFPHGSSPCCYPFGSR
jgi:NADPH:quinone reductase-like Zn-dependent oxidoreductase